MTFQNRLHSLVRRSASIRWMFLLGSVCGALADTIPATFSGEFENQKVILGPGISANGSCFALFGDYQQCVGFEGAGVDQPVDNPFIAGYLTFTAYPQENTAGNLYSLDLVITTDSDDPRYQGPDIVRITLHTQGGSEPDLLEFDNYPQFGALPTPRDGSGSKVQLKYKFGSLDFLGFGDVVSGPAIIFPDQTAVPEPSAVWLLVSACGLATARKRLGR